jgi:hypothetical protein
VNIEASYRSSCRDERRACGGVFESAGTLVRVTSRAELVRFSEVLDQVTGHGNTVVLVVCETATVYRREARPMPLVEVSEDLPRAAIETAVLGHQDGDVIRSTRRKRVASA